MTKLDELIEKFRIDKLDSMTKYPSILTYHDLFRGGVTKNLCEGQSFPPDTLLEVTEKIDGTNSRIICLGSDYIIGSRQELVHAKGDRIVQSEVVEPLLDGVKEYIKDISDESVLTVIYGETYGFGIQDGRQYILNSKHRKSRVFDMWKMPLTSIESLLEANDKAKIASWRDHMNQPYVTTNELDAFCKKYHIQRTPVRLQLNSNDMPTDVEESSRWLDMFAESVAPIDLPDETSTVNKKYLFAEGVVVRTADRSFIRKLRFEDYRKGKNQGYKDK